MYLRLSSNYHKQDGEMTNVRQHCSNAVFVCVCVCVCVCVMCVELYNAAARRQQVGSHQDGCSSAR